MMNTVNSRHTNNIRLRDQSQTCPKSEVADRFTQIKNTNTLSEIWNFSITKSFINKMKISFSSLLRNINSICSSSKKETSLPTRTMDTYIRNNPGASDADTLSVMSADENDINKKFAASSYEKDDPDLAYYGRSNRDDGHKTAFDAVSYLATSLTNKNNKATLTNEDINDINKRIKENTLTFYDIKSRAVNHGDLQIIRKLALKKQEDSRDLALNKQEDFYEKLDQDLESLSQLLGTPSNTEKRIDTVLNEQAILMEEMDAEAMSNEEIDAMDNMEWDDYKNSSVPDMGPVKESLIFK